MSVLVVVNESSAFVDTPSGPSTLREQHELERLVAELAADGLDAEIAAPDEVSGHRNPVLLAHGRSALPDEALRSRTVLLDADPHSYAAQTAAGVSGFVDHNSMFLWRTGQDDDLGITLRRWLASSVGSIPGEHARHDVPDWTTIVGGTPRFLVRAIAAAVRALESAIPPGPDTVIAP